MIKTTELNEIIARLEADVIDDGEELMMWLGFEGLDALSELVRLRGLIARAVAVIISKSYSEEEFDALIDEVAACLG